MPVRPVVPPEIEEFRDTRWRREGTRQIGTAHELERFGDLATNVAERVIYIVTGKLYEINANEPE